MPTAAPVDVPARPAPDPSAPPLRSLLAAGGIGAGTLLAIGGPWWIAADTASHRHNMFGLWLALAILTPISGIATVTYRLGRRHQMENRRLIHLIRTEQTESAATAQHLADEVTRMEEVVAAGVAQMQQLTETLNQLRAIVAAQARAEADAEYAQRHNSPPGAAGMPINGARRGALVALDPQ